MSAFYRLGVVLVQGQPVVVAEKNGRLLPIEDIVDPEALALLGAPLRDMMPLLQDWEHWNERISDVLRTGAAKSDRSLDAADAKFLPPLAAPGKIVCIGANYHDHIAEMPIPMTPKYPYSFLKPANNTLRGSGDPVEKPAISQMMDWEAELAVVIGRECRHVSAQDALSVVAGYTNYNDLSARDWLADRPPIGVDWVQHKAFDGFGPMGPYLVPAQFVEDPQDLSVRLSLNGVVKQDSTTRQMVFGVAAVIEHLSRIMTLYPGDVIATGTPAGVGHGRKPPEYLKAGDVVRMEIGSLGELVTPIV
jgi:2-keto-4-pentenoate hydratase/2-oxohepta-3-ene-1,7-dioic acid hydratase in catechol pathway